MSKIDSLNTKTLWKILIILLAIFLIVCIVVIIKMKKRYDDIAEAAFNNAISLLQFTGVQI